MDQTEHVERIVQLRKELFDSYEKSEKTKIALRKAIKDASKEKIKKKEASIISQAISDVSKSNVLLFSLGVEELKLPEKQKYKYKSNYEKFKLTSTVIITILTFLNLFVIKSKIFDTIQILTQMYIYSTLTIREHILINNGSHIKKWWIIHHYICIIITGMMLTCPEDSFYLIRAPVLKYLFILSCSQLVQYQYQMRRLYVLRALKKAHPLETTSEIVNISFIANLWGVIVILVLFQFVQIYVSYYIYRLHVQYNWTNYQPVIGAILICVMAFGNISTIVYTCYRKTVK